MSRRNNVRGPTSALTEFLKESGITPTTIARRVRTREVEQPVAGPSTEGQAADGAENDEQRQAEEKEYASDNLDDTDTERPPQKKRKLTKAQEAKQKAAAKKAAAAKKKKKGDDDDDYSDDEDAYTALSKMWKDEARPPSGGFCNCAKCGKQFTVTKYTMAANPPPGYLCHPCFKASGADPFKKPAAPRKRRAAADKRTITSFDERHITSLASLCVQIISKHIDDVEALGDIGSVNLDKIAKAIAKDRSLTPQNVTLLYDVENTNLTLYDATNLPPPALTTLAHLNPNLVNLRLDYCGRLTDDVLTTWSTALPHLRRLELLGPFLVRPPAWQTFFASHPDLEGFLVTQSPRFDLACVRSLVEHCPALEEVRLCEIGQMGDAFLEVLQRLGEGGGEGEGRGRLKYLDLSYPGDPEALSTEAVVGLLARVGRGLVRLEMSGNVRLGDEFLVRGVGRYVRCLEELVLVGLVELSDEGVARFFEVLGGRVRVVDEDEDGEESDGEDGDGEEDGDDRTPNPPLTTINLSRCPHLSGHALTALLTHSGSALHTLNINGWKDTPLEALMQIGERAKRLERVDVGWCRAVDGWVVRGVVEGCVGVREVGVWGCQRVEGVGLRKRGVALLGVEAHSV